MSCAPPAALPLHALAHAGVARARAQCHGAVPRVPAAGLTAAQFVERYVSKSQPVVIAGGAASWPALSSWSASSLARERASVRVCFSPAGRGDALVDVQCGAGGAPAPLFVQPEMREMALGDAVALLQSRDDSGGVPYVAAQNDSLRRETPGLLAAVCGGDLPWAPWRAADADAVNLWIGDERSVTSCHKDHYENLVAVVIGEKVFRLNAPADALWLYEREVASGRFRQDAAGDWRIDVDGAPGVQIAGDRRPAGWRWLHRGAAVPLATALHSARRQPWITADPFNPAPLLTPLFSLYADTQEVRVAAGDVLYLPPLWHHSVSQSGFCVAVNAWHDMQFDTPLHALHSLAAALAPAVQASWVPEEALGNGAVV
jgi:jumonji domain-containing protein 7